MSPLSNGFVLSLASAVQPLTVQYLVISVYTISNPGGGLTFSTSTVGGDKVTTFTAGTGNIQFA